jgi:hypothetical protein|uniref:Uncharacterized protein n=1 Tax=viral metagenome TaxID=1070528 RepID=A0A6C0IUQ6_9ZZZZ
MPLVIKDKRSGEEKVCGIVCESLQCGHCLLPVQPNTVFMAFDDPYFCIVHETCVPLFNFDKQSRRPKGIGRETAIKELDEYQKQLHTMTERPWWQNKAPKSYQKALQDLLLLHQSLRTSRVIA